MSSLSENIRIALGALFANKLRAALTTLGIGIGIGAVIILISLGNAAQDYINRQFLGTGADLVTINSSNSGGFGGRGDTASVKLGMQDVASLSNRQQCRDVCSSCSCPQCAGHNEIRAKHFVDPGKRHRGRLFRH